MRYIAALSLIAATTVAPQGPPAQPVQVQDYARVAIARHDVGDNGKSQIVIDARGGVRATNVTLAQLIVKAFGVRPERVAGGPEWIRTDRFDLVADPAPGIRRVDADALARVVQDRFRLQARWEPRPIPVYLLKRLNGSRPAPGIRPPASGCEQTLRPAGAVGCHDGVGWNAPGWLFVRRGQVSSLAAFLPSEVGREVLDQTGLKGTYDIDLKFAPGAESPFAGENVEGMSMRPNIFAAIRQQLGFELKPSTAELPVQWIESAQRPQLD